MQTILENDLCQVTIKHHGAELSSFILKNAELEFIWQANQDYWGRHAPILFPIVGRLKENKYTYKENDYHMGQHGFARDMMFELEEQSDNAVTFLLTDSEETLKVYPFSFELRLSYELVGQELKVGYDVRTHSEEMFFAIGGHPAFNVPLVEGSKFDDYYIHFAPSKSRFLLPLKGPYVDLKEKTLAQTNTSIQLHREFFKNDAFILETIGENKFSILSDKTEHGVSISYNDLPYVGIWTPYHNDAPFVCIEPWAGIADTLETTGDLEKKLGINKLVPGDVFRKSYVISIH